MVLLLRPWRTGKGENCYLELANANLSIKYGRFNVQDALSNLLSLENPGSFFPVFKAPFIQEKLLMTSAVEHHLLKKMLDS